MKPSNNTVFWFAMVSGWICFGVALMDGGVMFAFPSALCFWIAGVFAKRDKPDPDNVHNLWRRK